MAQELFADKFSDSFPKIKFDRIIENSIAVIQIANHSINAMNEIKLSWRDRFKPCHFNEVMLNLVRFIFLQEGVKAEDQAVRFMH